jgi:hypothetical protein
MWVNKQIWCATIACALLPITFTVRADCGIEGDSTNPKLVAIDQLKNRSQAPSIVLPALDWNVLLKPGDDTNRLDSSGAATLTGYVAAVQPGGVESCNCHAKDLPHRDTHIYVAQDSKHAAKSQCVIVEVTPRFRDLHPDWTSALLKKNLTGHIVTFTGWLLFDAEHKQNAVNTEPGNKKDWRATCWELHPVTDIEIVK